MKKRRDPFNSQWTGKQIDCWLRTGKPYEENELVITRDMSEMYLENGQLIPVNPEPITIQEPPMPTADTSEPLDISNVKAGYIDPKTLDKPKKPRKPRAKKADKPQEGI
jgi:hypothetical protein